MSKSIIIIISLFVLISLVYSAYSFMQNKQETRVDTQGYLEAEAVITAVFPVRITRYGAKQPHYDIRFTDHTGKEQVRFRCALGGGYAVDDTVTILYDPKNPKAEIVLKKN